MRLFAIALLAVFGLTLSPICCGAFAQEPQVVDGIAAVVNGDVITYSQVRVLSAPREKLLRSQYTGQELGNKLKEARELALKDLIDRRLVIQAFKKESYQIPDHFVDQRMQEIIRESFGGDRNTFIKTLEAQNYTLGEFKEKEMERIMVQAMRTKNVKITGGTVDGNTATLLATGKDDSGTANGKITMVLEGGAWKVQNENWKSGSH